MDDVFSVHDNLETVLQDPSEEPCVIPLQCLRDITNIFSGDRELGRGGFGVVYKVKITNSLYVISNMFNRSLPGYLCPF